MIARNSQPQDASLPRLSAHPNRFRWSKRLADLLGKMADKRLAALAGVHPQVVARERRRRSLPASKPRRPPIDWTPEMIAVLGTDADRAIAAALGVDHRSVFRKRRLLGIPPHVAPMQKEKPGFAWTPETLALLGTQSERQIAKRLGISAATVHNKRRDLGITSYRPPQERIAWTAEMLALLGAVPDRTIARRFKMTNESVKHKRDELGLAPHQQKSRMIVRTRALAAILKLPNRELRARYGIGKGTALKLRREFGIPTPDARNHRWTPERLSRLGTEPDARLAHEMGLTPGAVSDKRRRLGIAPHVGRRRWEAAELALFGKLTNREIAAQTGRALNAVHLKRRGLGVAPPRHTKAQTGR